MKKKTSIVYVRISFSKKRKVWTVYIFSILIPSRHIIRCLSLTLNETFAIIKYTGGKYGSRVLSEILQFDPLTGQWKQVDKMSRTRVSHAVSVINFEPEICV